MTGRPTRCTPEAIDEICERLASGESLRTICKDKHLPAERSVFRTLAADAKVREVYNIARANQAEAMLEEILAISDDTYNDYSENADGKVVPNIEHISRSRLRVDTRKWAMSKLLPKKYGDKTVIAGDEDNPIRVLEVRRVIIDADDQDSEGI